MKRILSRLSDATTAVPSERRRFRLTERASLQLGVASIAVSWVVVAAVVLPVVLLERTADWTAFAGAADALRGGTPLYPWTSLPDIRAISGAPYLYPPPLAAIWALGLSAPLFAALKMVALAAASWFFARSVLRSSAAGAVIFGAAVLIFPPVVHDTVLGNVMALYLTAVFVSLARSGWIGAGAIGATCAIMLKPAIGPYLVWLLIARRLDFGRAVVAGVLVTLVFAFALGPGRYFEYLAALPSLGGLAAPFTGNLGLVSISPMVAAVGVAVAYLWTIFAAVRLEEMPAAAVALAMTQLAQPTIGFDYAVLLIPALALVWKTDQRAGVIAGVTMPILVVISPVLAGVALAVSATILGRRQTRTELQ